jgi:hypothetical protein
MYRAHFVTSTITQQDRQAICGHHYRDGTGKARDRSIGIAVSILFERSRLRTMGLIDPARFSWKIQLLAQQFAVLRNQRRVISDM